MDVGDESELKGSHGIVLIKENNVFIKISGELELS